MIITENVDGVETVSRRKLNDKPFLLIPFAVKPEVQEAFHLLNSHIEGNYGTGDK